MVSRAAAHHEAARRPLWLRVLWFVLVGWWFSAIWITGAYVMFVTVIGIPVGIVMLNVLPSVVTLQRN